MKLSSYVYYLMVYLLSQISIRFILLNHIHLFTLPHNSELIDESNPISINGNIGLPFFNKFIEMWARKCVQIMEVSSVVQSLWFFVYIRMLLYIAAMEYFERSMVSTAIGGNLLLEHLKSLLCISLYDIWHHSCWFSCCKYQTHQNSSESACRPMSKDV